jgi:hypothetical protein
METGQNVQPSVEEVLRAKPGNVTTLSLLTGETIVREKVKKPALVTVTLVQMIKVKKVLTFLENYVNSLRVPAKGIGYFYI